MHGFKVNPFLFISFYLIICISIQSGFVRISDHLLQQIAFISQQSTFRLKSKGEKPHVSKTLVVTWVNCQPLKFFFFCLGRGWQNKIILDFHYNFWSLLLNIMAWRYNMKNSWWLPKSLHREFITDNYFDINTVSWGRFYGKQCKPYNVNHLLIYF